MEDLPLKGSYYKNFSMPGGPIAGGLEVRAGCFEVRAGCLEVSPRVASRSHVRVAWRSQRTNFETKILNFRCFLALLTKMSFSRPHYYPKYEVWVIEFFLW